MSTKTKTAPEKRKARRLPVPASVFGLLCKQQVADALGGCSTRQVDKMIASGEFPRADSGIGRNPRWSVELVNEWCRTHRRADGG